MTAEHAPWFSGASEPRGLTRYRGLGCSSRSIVTQRHSRLTQGPLCHLRMQTLPGGRTRPSRGRDVVSAPPTRRPAPGSSSAPRSSEEALSAPV